MQINRTSRSSSPSVWLADLGFREQLQISMPSSMGSVEILHVIHQ